MSLPLPPNLQTDPQTHLQLCKAHESAAKEKVIYEHGYKSVRIRGSNSVGNLVAILGTGRGTPSWKSSLAPFPFSIQLPLITFKQACMRVVTV